MSVWMHSCIETTNHSRMSLMSPMFFAYDHDFCSLHDQFSRTYSYYLCCSCTIQQHFHRNSTIFASNKLFNMTWTLRQHTHRSFISHSRQSNFKMIERTRKQPRSYILLTLWICCCSSHQTAKWSKWLQQQQQASKQKSKPYWPLK